MDVVVTFGKALELVTEWTKQIIDGKDNSLETTAADWWTHGKINQTNSSNKDGKYGPEIQHKNHQNNNKRIRKWFGTIGGTMETTQQATMAMFGPEFGHRNYQRWTQDSSNAIGYGTTQNQFGWNTFGWYWQ